LEVATTDYAKQFWRSQLLLNDPVKNAALRKEMEAAAKTDAACKRLYEQTVRTLDGPPK